MRTFIFLAALTSLAAVPAYAANPTNPTNPAKPANSAKPTSEKLICKGYRVVGSNLTKRLCMTKSRWEEERRMSQDALDFSRPPPVASDRSTGFLGN